MKVDVAQMDRFGVCPQCELPWKHMHHPGGAHWAFCWLHHTKAEIPQAVWEQYCQFVDINPQEFHDPSPSWLDAFHDVGFCYIRKVRAAKGKRQMDLL